MGRGDMDLHMVIPGPSRNPTPARESSLGCEPGPSYEEAMAELMAAPLNYCDSSDKMGSQVMLSQ